MTFSAFGVVKLEQRKELNMRLKNKSALITGGTSGIGLATAKLFIAEGARVAVTGRDETVFDRVKAELGEHALVLKGDVRSIDDMRAIAAEMKAQFGGLDIVFANAGWAFPSALNDIDEKLYSEIMDINVKGVVLTLQAVLPDLREGSSVILNTSFVAQTGKHGISLTAAAKAAVRSLARSWSYEFLDRKIRFNAIAPGAIDTPLISRWGMSEEWVRDRKAEFAEAIPAGHLGRAEDIAYAALYLASDESAYVIGTELIVDGGASQL
ncbi:NAD(P)-dependent dehydrogenase (short-subunit alcohol dehydrogenase family) [Paraburkholderia tropica]|uniref:NAD(P)-dependent dehydrogenase (Short-subunit alcohol dehydrogenase family) n=2 Tax=Paraburkholderia tropica TaxID=92647 RepID=A0ABX5MD84_9BURK|nr:NAD(P)-dependent dehydrogenase (short-subunit alcohol dehydrogenase family) [Paraburkholderia tropica]MBB6324165.1 NAD(P)-dependent dehydrogenase (short-subunit alcohol dehydrogenase family) [Paraburkholderia tropica]PXX04093.1 NAD(P)-dependent dehydrogenase (short-subunit alcohol dehydrogenase family) [Paraburkholderia tropica]PZW69476.1 NAD(P)-dependent dehydrogenase (short-subunit alcohol dehydrogenase family) [Paraburkholderia tropica]